MNIRKTVTFLTGISMLAASAAMIALAQEHTNAPSKGGKASPHQSLTATVGGKKITIVYGRPYKKGRKIFGGLEQYGKVWRTGADEATTFTTAGDVMLGALHVPAGTYSLFTVPEQNKWTLILNKTVSQWGAFSYNAAQDLGRAEMKVEKASSPTEQLTFSIESKGSQGTLKIAWDDVVASIPIMMH